MQFPYVIACYAVEERRRRALFFIEFPGMAN